MPEAVDLPRAGTAIRLSLVDANLHPRLEPFDCLDTTVSYFLGNDPGQWRPDVPVWGGVRYVDLYPGVDLELTGEAGYLVPRLVAQPGADLSVVRLRVEGADTVVVDGDALRLSTAAGDARWPLLRADGSSGEATVRPLHGAAFEVTAPLAAEGPGSPSASAPDDDPSDLLYSTLLGGSDSDHSYSIAVDGSGAAYVTGYTYSFGFPTTPGAFNRRLSGDRDAFVVKLATFDITPPTVSIDIRDPKDGPINRDLCPTPIVLSLFGSASDLGGLDWVKLHYDLNGTQQPDFLLDLDGEAAYEDGFAVALGPFSQAGVVHYFLEARDLAGNLAQDPPAGTAPYTLTVSDCSGCTSWSVPYTPRADGFMFLNWREPGVRGYCTGMAATSIDFFGYSEPIPPEYNHWAGSGDDPDNDLSCYIKHRHDRLQGPIKLHEFDLVSLYPDLEDRNLLEYTKIKNQIKDLGQVALVGLGFFQGRSVTAYAISECTDGRTFIYTYDPNNVLPVGGAYPGVLSGTQTATAFELDPYSPNKYRDLYADSRAPDLVLPQYPDLSNCDDSNIDQAASEVAAAGFVSDERSTIESILSTGQPTVTYPLWNDTSHASAVFASWPAGSMRLQLYRPDGSLFAEQEGTQSPLQIDISAGSTFPSSSATANDSGGGQCRPPPREGQTSSRLSLILAGRRRGFVVTALAV